MTLLSPKGIQVPILAKRFTPWISATDPETSNVYIFRLQLHRRNGAVMLELRDDSPTLPTATRVVPRSRPGYTAFVDAAILLLNLSHRDPTASPPIPGRADPRRWVWNRKHPNYLLRMDSAHQVTLYLDALLYQKRGNTPLAARIAAKAEAYAGNRTSGVQHPSARARANRRLELLDLHQKLLNHLLPHYDKVTAALGNGRGYSMVGYTKHEVRQIRERLFTLRHNLQALHDLLAYDQFEYPAGELPLTLDAAHATGPGKGESGGIARALRDSSAGSVGGSNRVGGIPSIPRVVIGTLR